MTIRPKLSLTLADVVASAAQVSEANDKPTYKQAFDNQRWVRGIGLTIQFSDTLCRRNDIGESNTKFVIDHHHFALRN